MHKYNLSHKINIFGSGSWTQCKCPQRWLA